MPGIEDLQNKKAGQSLNNFLNTDSKQIIFGIEAQINNLMGEYEMAVRNGEMERAEMLNNKINELDKMKIDIANASVPTKAQNLRQMYNEISLRAAPGGDMGSEISRSLVTRDPELVRFIQKDQGDLDKMFGGVGVKGYAGGAEVVGIVYDDGVVQISEQEVQDAIKEYKRMNRELVEAMNIPDSEIRQEVLPKLRNSKEVRLMEGGRYNPSENPNRPEMIEGSGRTISNIDLGRTISDIDRQGRTISDIDRGGRTISNMDRQMIKGYAEGDEVSMMMMELEGDQGMSKSDMEGLEGLAEISGPETEMLNNIINQIIELIAQGATEEEVIAFLRQQGLDDEDISAVMSMLSQQLTAGEEDIGSQLAALG